VRTNVSFVVSTALAGAAIAALTTPAAAVDPVASHQFLTTGNGFGFQVFDTNQNAIVQYLERPYRFMRPNPGNPDGEGIVRRNLAFDTYFGVRAPAGAVWLGKVGPDSVGYLEQTNVIRSTRAIGAVETESLFWAPYGYQGNAMIMVLRATNTGGSAASVEAFSIHNFKLGSAPNPDSPGDDGESIVFAGGAAVETGPGGGAIVLVPIGGADVSSCAAAAFSTVQGGGDLTAQHTCSGSDRINAFQQSLGTIAPGETASWGVVVLFDADGNASAARAAWDAFAADRDADTLLADALAEWDAWRTPAPGGLSAAERRVWRQSEAVLRMGQVLEPWSASPKRKSYGMVLASLPPGGWHSGWVRDAVYAIVAMARTGHHAEAKAALNFFLDAEANKFGSYLNDVTYRITTVRYFGNGEEEADYSGQPTRNIEIDGWGLFLWAARVYVDASGDTEWLSETTRYGETVYDVIRDEVAEALAANLEPNGMAIADASIWEVHWGNREHFLYTTASTARGFCDMAALSRRHGDLGDRDRYQTLSQNAVEAIRTTFVDQNKVLGGSVERLASGSQYRDGAVTEAFTWRLIAPTDSIATATINDFSLLKTPAGGYKRVEGSSDPYDTDEWILIDLRASDVFRATGQPQRADALLDWVVSQASVNYDLIPELYNTSTSRGQIGGYAGSIPMVGYGAGAYQLSVLERAGSHEHDDCGTEDPADYVDAGPITGTDGGPGAGGDGGFGVDGRTGTACVCSAGDAPTGDWWLIALVAMALVRRRRRPRREV
jgi:MYXO-CTERM domain-containing protein